MNQAGHGGELDPFVKRAPDLRVASYQGSAVDTRGRFTGLGAKDRETEKH